MKKHLRTLRSLRLDNGLYVASTSAEYQYTWFRDNFYCALPELIFNPRNYIQTYHSWLNYYQDWGHDMITRNVLYPPHVKFNLDLSLLDSGWNHDQLDVIGYFFYGISLGEKAGLRIFRNEKDWLVVQDLLKYLDRIDFSNYLECGAWEENNETPRLSSLGILVGGLEALKDIPNQSWAYIDDLITDGIKSIQKVFPKETPTREVDMAQLFLLFPFNLFTKRMENIILKQVHNKLERSKGLIRYEGDLYFNASSPGRGYHNHLYNKNITEAYGNEAEWPMGFIYLGLIYLKRGDLKKAQYYRDKVHSRFPIPELYVDGVSNGNQPLGWATALMLILEVELKRHKSKWFDVWYRIRNRISFLL